MAEIQGVCFGNLASKSNTRRLVTYGGRPHFIKSERAITCEQQFLPQLHKIIGKKLPLEGDVVLEATIFYDSNRPDLDESLFMDLLEKAGAYKNDRQIKEKHIFRGLDRKNPRVEFLVYPLQ